MVASYLASLAHMYAIVSVCFLYGNAINKIVHIGVYMN